MKRFRIMLAIAIAAVTMMSCGSTGGEKNKAVVNSNETLRLGNFSADSAFAHIERQVAFGPRVPGTESHAACRDYIVSELQRAGVDSLIVQDAVVEAYTGDKLPIYNIMGRFNPNVAAKRRVLLAAHWDTRPWADRENSADERMKPIAGANDGGSGVGVLLEIARNLGQRRPSVGVDLLFVDAEDYGDASGFDDRSETWCLGSRYWTQHMTPYTPATLPVYGILLDMVGGRDAKFHYEYFSQKNAPNVTAKVWSEAERLGYNHIFVRSIGGAVTDDHIVLTEAGIPTTDIIETLNEQTQSFNPTWHTLDDTPENIDKNTLKAVGETVLNVLYKEKAF